MSLLWIMEKWREIERFRDIHSTRERGKKWGNDWYFSQSSPLIFFPISDSTKGPTRVSAFPYRTPSPMGPPCIGFSIPYVVSLSSLAFGLGPSPFPTPQTSLASVAIVYQSLFHYRCLIRVFPNRFHYDSNEISIDVVWG